MKECIGDSTRIDSFFQTDDLTEVGLTAYANCNGNLEGQISVRNDSLNLIYTPKVTRILNKKTGELEEFIEIATCDCIFKFNYSIRGLQAVDKSRIKINGETIDEINRRSYVYEPLEIKFDVDTTWSSDDTFTVVEQSAQFSGGAGKFTEYIESNLIYPRNAEMKGISGKVFVEFVINKDGSIDDTTVKVVRGLDDSCDSEARRLMKECPDWIHATIKGQPVRQKLVLPITFSLPKGGMPTK